MLHAALSPCLQCGVVKHKVEGTLTEEVLGLWAITVPGRWRAHSAELDRLAWRIRAGHCWQQLLGRDVLDNSMALNCILLYEAPQPRCALAAQAGCRQPTSPLCPEHRPAGFHPCLLPAHLKILSEKMERSLVKRTPRSIG